MKLNFLSFNVRGLNNDLAIDSLQAYVQDHRPELDILALQEHKLKRESLHQLGTRIWRPAIFGGLKASMGYGYSQGDQEVGSGGSHLRGTSMGSAYFPIWPYLE